MGPAPSEGSCKGGKVLAHLETPSQAGSEGSFGITEGNAVTGVGRQDRKKSAQRSLLISTSQPRHCLHTSFSEWRVGADAQNSPSQASAICEP